MTDDDRDDRADETEVPSSRRVWQRWNPSGGSSALSLKAMAVLQDAGRPLTRDEIAERLLASVDAYGTSYLHAWYVRRLAQQARSNARYRGTRVTSHGDDREVTSLRTVRLWLTQVFLKRVGQGSTLRRDADGRYRPGGRPPRVQTPAGQVIPFTPETRRALAEAEADARTTYRLELEWKQVTKRLNLRRPGARSQLLGFLIRRLVNDATSQPLDDRHLREHCSRLVQLADTPAMTRALLKLAIERLIP